MAIEGRHHAIEPSVEGGQADREAAEEAHIWLDELEAAGVPIALVSDEGGSPGWTSLLPGVGLYDILRHYAG